jgi:hypothetical protein
VSKHFVIATFEMDSKSGSLVLELMHVLSLVKPPLHNELCSLLVFTNLLPDNSSGCSVLWYKASGHHLVHLDSSTNDTWVLGTLSVVFLITIHERWRQLISDETFQQQSWPLVTTRNMKH